MELTLNDLKEISIGPNTKISEVLKTINANEIKFVMVINKQKKLLGTVTDGDIRRTVLKQIDLNSPVSQIMNKNAITAPMNLSKENLIKLMKIKSIQQLPILDEKKCVVDLVIFEDLISPVFKDNPVIIMAGGLGKRLRPLTKNIPKPMLLIGNKPILQRIFELLIDQGFQNFYFSVNFKGDLIEDFFGNGSKWGVKINYITEDNKMGTAGSLSLIKEKFTSDILVMNADLFTDINFIKLLEFHKNKNSDATMVVNEKEFEIPYGVIKLKKHKILSISEKPKTKFYINSGIYVISPNMLKKIPKKFIDMTSFFDKMILNKLNVNAYVSDELWVDIGSIKDFEKTQKLF